MCLIARHLEERGLPTVCLASARDIIEAGRPPRAVYVDHPLGFTAGRPGDPDGQRRIVTAALQALASVSRPASIVDLPVSWPEDDDWRAAATDPGKGDTRQPRDTTPRYQFEADRLLAESCSSGAGAGRD